MTHQEIFNKVASHLFAQDHPAYANNGEPGLGCAYLNDAGEKCSVGCILSEALAKKVKNLVMDLDTLIDNAKNNGFAEDATFLNNNYILLGHLQEAHDTTYAWVSSDLMRDSLNWVADVFNLEHLPSSPEFYFKNR